jgi:hypothetical protein
MSNQTSLDVYKWKIERKIMVPWEVLLQQHRNRCHGSWSFLLLLRTLFVWMSWCVPPIQEWFYYGKILWIHFLSWIQDFWNVVGDFGFLAEEFHEEKVRVWSLKIRSKEQDPKSCFILLTCSLGWHFRIWLFAGRLESKIGWFPGGFLMTCDD